MFQIKLKKKKTGKKSVAPKKGIENMLNAVKSFQKKKGGKKKYNTAAWSSFLKS